MHADTELVLKMPCDQMLYVTLHGRSEASSTNDPSFSTNSGDPNSNLRALARAAVDTPADEEERWRKRRMRSGGRKSSVVYWYSIQ
jgi:hypothetical protein